MARRTTTRPVNSGLGLMFQEEGPGLGPSTGYLKRPGDIFSSEGLMEKIARTRKLYSDMPEEAAEYIQDLRESEETELAKRLGGLDTAYEKIKRNQATDLFASPESKMSDLRKQQMRDYEAARIGTGLNSDPFGPAMEMGVGANELSPLDQIAEQLNKIESGKGAGDEAAAQSIIADKAKAQTAEDFRAAEAKIAEGMMPEMGADPQNVQKALDETFAGAMDDFINSVRGAGPDKKERTLDEYKKEFAEATGVDISGKVDKSSALMALGLALMQNRAGSGFNVGRILSAVGKAGSAALPALEKAKEKAQTAVLAAGKYALESRSSDRAKDEAADLAGKKRGKYWVYKKGGKGTEFANFDDGEFVDLNPFELNKLIENKDFAGQYEFIDASDRMSILEKRAEGVDLGDMWSGYERVSLIGGKADDVAPELQVLAASADPNYKGLTPTAFKLAEKPETVIRRFAEMQQSINSGADKFKNLLEKLNSGVTIPEQFLSSANEILVSFGIGETSDITEAKRLLKNIAIDEATAILKESGKTLSDTDRQLVRDRVGQINWGSADVEEIRRQLNDIYYLTVEKPQENLDRAIGWLEENAGIQFNLGQSDMPTQAELDAMNKVYGTNFTMDDYKKSGS